ncbi:response regulator transcription factor [Kitasatospora purpeofusca]|uniref:response regulator transcription factor n=1 Tax=Kitasatospora purpeofusca TaxID=67352 RepID=UPI002A59D089|nr:response regulator transcription factor [Kitasatospora purpeofusca]MDY0813858.1 response regulator transcription factor [Kitasatospora purpeofusca]
MNRAEPAQGRPVRVVIVDDEQLMRTSLRTILSAHPGIEVTAISDGGTALATVLEQHPDLVLLDIQMPHPDGLTVLRQIQELPAPPVVAMLTAFGSDEYVRTALRLGAAGYLLKDTDPEQLAREVKVLAAGEHSLAPGVTKTVIDGYLAHADAAKETAAHVSALTERERQALALVGHGLTNNQIVRRMDLAPSTAKDHISVLLTKLGLRSRVQAAVLAERAGLLRTRSTADPHPPHAAAAAATDAGSRPGDGVES